MVLCLIKTQISNLMHLKGREQDNKKLAKATMFVSPFILFHLAIVLSVLPFTDSDYPLGIFKLFLPGTLWIACSLKLLNYLGFQIFYYEVPDKGVVCTQCYIYVFIFMLNMRLRKVS